MCVFGFTIYEDVNNKISLVSVPSGEVFYITELQLYNLYESDLIRFNFDKEFWYIDDKNKYIVEIRLR